MTDEKQRGISKSPFQKCAGSTHVVEAERLAAKICCAAAGAEVFAEPSLCVNQPVRAAKK